MKNYTDILPNQRVFSVASILNSSTYFRRLNGKDHFVIEDDSPFFTWKHDIASWRYFNLFCQECLLVSPDNTASLRNKFRYLIRDKLISAPHPSAYHYIENLNVDFNKETISHIPWIDNNDRHDKIIVVIVGTVKKASRSATKIRKILDQQCASEENRISNSDSAAKVFHFFTVRTICFY